MDGGASGLISSALKVSQVVYELAAVGQQAQDLLRSTKHVARSLETTQTLRRQKSQHLSSTEKGHIDAVMVDASYTLKSVAALVEPVRVDMQTKHGKIGLLNRGLFVFRDNPKVPTQLSQLNITSQSLNTALSILSQREGRVLSPPLRSPQIQHRMSMASLKPDYKHLPSYEESEFLNRRRSRSVVPKTTETSPEQARTASPTATSEQGTSSALKDTISAEHYDLADGNGLGVHQKTDEKSTAAGDGMCASLDGPFIGSDHVVNDQIDFFGLRRSDVLSSISQQRYMVPNATENAKTLQTWAPAITGAAELPSYPLNTQQDAFKQHNPTTSIHQSQPIEYPCFLPSTPYPEQTSHVPRASVSSAQFELELHLPPVPPSGNISTTQNHPERSIPAALRVTPPSAVRPHTHPPATSQTVDYPPYPTRIKPDLPYPDHHPPSINPCTASDLAQDYVPFVMPQAGLNARLSRQCSNSTISELPSPPMLSPSLSFNSNSTSRVRQSISSTSTISELSSPPMLSPTLSFNSSGTGHSRQSINSLDTLQTPVSPPDAQITDFELRKTQSVPPPAEICPENRGVRARRYAWLERHASE